MDKEKTIIQRFDAVKAWMEQRVEAGLQEKPQFNSDPYFKHVRTLFYLLDEAMFQLKGTFRVFAIDPYTVFRDHNAMSKALVFRELLYKFEQLMEGKDTSEGLITYVLTYAQSEVARGCDEFNSTNPLDNIMAVKRNNLYCAVIKSINHSFEYEAEREKRRIEAEQNPTTKGAKKKAKA